MDVPDQLEDFALPCRLVASAGQGVLKMLTSLFHLTSANKFSSDTLTVNAGAVHLSLFLIFQNSDSVFRPPLLVFLSSG